MDAKTAYRRAAQAYTDGVRVLFAPSGVPTGERGGRGPASPKDLVGQAEKLSARSGQLTAAAKAQLADRDPLVRVQASTQLLAKALTDLEVSAYLFEAAQDEEDGVAWEAKAEERSSADRSGTEERLKLILGELEAAPSAPDRGGEAPPDVPAARLKLKESVGDALTSIPEAATESGQKALQGLVGLGVAEVARAAGVAGMDIAKALGQAEKVTRLYDAFRGFALRAYDSVLALVGQPALQAVTSQVLDWMKELKKGKFLGDLLDKVYETGQTRHELDELVTESEARLEQLVAAITNVEALDAAYQKQVQIADKLLQGFKSLGGVAVAVLPQGRLLMAAAYIILAAYVILAGADYVDARRLQLLKRVPGVRQVVETGLAPG